MFLSTELLASFCAVVIMEWLLWALSSHYVWDTHFCSLSDMTSTETSTQIWLGINQDKFFCWQEWFSAWDFLKLPPSSSSPVTQRQQCLLRKIASRILPSLAKVWPRQGDNMIICSLWAYLLWHCLGSSTKMGARARPSTLQGSPIQHQLAHISSETRWNDGKDLSNVCRLYCLVMPESQPFTVITVLQLRSKTGLLS